VNSLNPIQNVKSRYKIVLLLMADTIYQTVNISRTVRSTGAMSWVLPKKMPWKMGNVPAWFACARSALLTQVRGLSQDLVTPLKLCRVIELVKQVTIDQRVAQVCDRFVWKTARKTTAQKTALTTNVLRLPASRFLIAHEAAELQSPVLFTRPFLLRTSHAFFNVNRACRVFILYVIGEQIFTQVRILIKLI